ncbi:MAG: PAS domain S-box protein [Actinomycetota bacterium]
MESGNTAEEEELRRASGSLADAVIITDERGDVLFIHPALERCIGLPRGGAAGRPWEEAAPLLDAVSGKPLRGIVDRVLETGCGASAANALLILTESRRIPVSLQVEPLRNGADARRGAIVRLRGISDEPAGYQALQQSETRYRTLFDASPLPTWVFDAETLRFLAVNEAAVDHYGYSREEFLAMTLAEIRPPDELPRLQAHLATDPECREPRECFRHRKRDGAIIDVEISGRPIKHDGRAARLVVARDVTAQKRTERQTGVFLTLGRELSQASTPEQALRMILDAADRLLGWDACWLQLQGAAELGGIQLLMDTIDGQRMDCLPTAPDMLAAPIAQRTLLEGPQLLLHEPGELPQDTQRSGDFSRSPLSVMLVPFRSGEQALGVLSIQSYQPHAYTQESLRLLEALADYCVTALERTRLEEAQRRTEEQLRQVQKMEAVGQLAGGIAHDFNNLLSVINGYSELAQHLLPPEHGAKEMLGQIHRAGERAAGLTRRLLAFSRQQVLAPRLLDLNHVIRDAEKMLRRLIGEDVELVTALSPGLGQVMADAGQIEQILLNLAVNARDAIARHGQIRVRTMNVDLDEEYVRAHPTVTAGSYVLLALSDSGSGMSEEVKQRIFEPFFTTKGPGRGTGLGLATVFGIVQQSGGHVEVVSEVGQGTTFKVYLPRVECHAQAPREAFPESPGSRRGQETILLAEDEVAVRRYTRQALEAHGYTVLEAADGAEALAVCKGRPEPIHLMALDVVMPGLGGRELAEQLAVLRPESAVLFLSGYTSDAVIRHGVREDQVAFLQKPFTVDALARKVREVLDAQKRGADGPAPA